MGTRGVTRVISNGKTKVAQYGQWDHYPSGQGLTILNFLRSFKGNYTPFKKRLEDVRFQTKSDEKKVDIFLKGIGCKDGWMTMEQSDLYQKKFPLLTRDNGAKVLELLMESKVKKPFLVNAEDFINDGLFCEYHYLVDLDNGTFEIFDGPIHQLKRYSLKRLPSEKKYLNDMKKLQSND